jgi:phosphoglycolate phosphatase-like HAD superfamily hydrolase
VEGTLIDCASQTLASWREVLREFGHDIPLARLQHYSGMDGNDMLGELLPGQSSDDLAKIVKRQGEHYREKYLPQVRAFPQVRELFERLKQEGFRAGVATSCQADELARYFELMRIKDLIDATACGSDAKKGKPHPDLIKVALRNLGAHNGETAVMIGDSLYDAQAAGMLSLTAIGMRSGGFSDKDLRTAGCAAVYADPADLLEHFDAAFGGK